MTTEVATSYDEMLEQVEVFMLRLDWACKQTPILRYGQAFINTFMPYVTWPELYHERDQGKAREMVREHIIKVQNPDFFNRIMNVHETKLRAFL